MEMPETEDRYQEPGLEYWKNRGRKARPEAQTVDRPGFAGGSNF